MQVFQNKDGGFFPILAFCPHMNGVFRAPKNAGFTKWPAELRFLKTAASRFTCGRTKMVFFEHDDVIHYTAAHTL